MTEDLMEMETEKKIRVFHVDDDPDSRRLMSILLRLEPDIEEVGSRGDATGLIDDLARVQPDVLVMDLTMRGKDPIEAIREIKEVHPGLRVVVLSGQADPRVLDSARAAGAAQCVLKASDIQATLSAIRGD